MMTIGDDDDDTASSADELGSAGSMNPLSESASHLGPMSLDAGPMSIGFESVSTTGNFVSPGEYDPAAEARHHDLCPPAEPLFREASDPAISFVRLHQIHMQIVAMGCPSCLGAFRAELKLRSVLATSCGCESAPNGLSMRIVDSIRSIDLTQVEVTDIDF